MSRRRYRTRRPRRNDGDSNPALYETYKPSLAQISVTGPDPQTIRYQYDGFGTMTEETKTLGGETVSVTATVRIVPSATDRTVINADYTVRHAKGTGERGPPVVTRVRRTAMVYLPVGER